MLENTAPHTHPNSEKLIADAMTFSGNANGFNIYGFQDMLKSTKVSAPFTEASFRVNTPASFYRIGVMEIEVFRRICVTFLPAISVSSHVLRFWFVM